MWVPWEEVEGVTMAKEYMAGSEEARKALAAVRQRTSR